MDRLKEAVQANRVDEVKKLVEGTSIDKKELSKLLTLASRKGHFDTVQYLLTVDGIDVNYKEEENGEFALFVAAYNGHKSVVELLLQQPTLNVYQGDKERTTALMYAAKTGNVDIVRMILTKMKELEETKQRLKDKINKRDDLGMTALNWLTSGSNPNMEVMELLLEAGADINSQDNDGETALMTASRRGLTNIVGSLLEREDTNFNIRDKKRRTSIMVAKSQDIEKLFPDKNDRKTVDLRGFRKVELIQAAAHGNLSKVKTLIANKAKRLNINERDADGYTALIKASQNGHAAVVNELLQVADIDINMKNKDGDSALFCAIDGDHEDITEKLLNRHRIDAKTRDKKGRTPLIYSAECGRFKTVKLLIKLGARAIDVNAKDNNGDSAIIVAYDKKNWDIVDKLMSVQSVRSNIDFMGVHREKCRAIIASVVSRKEKVWPKLLCNSSAQRVLSLLILMASNITPGGIESQTGFWHCVFKQGNRETKRQIKMYLKGKEADKNGNTLFHYCAKAVGEENDFDQNTLQLLEILPAAYYANLHRQVNENGDTMLHVALQNKRTDIFSHIIDRFNRYGGTVYPWLNELLVMQNNANNTFLSIAIKSDIEDEKIIEMMDALEEHQIESLCQITDRDDNTLLHLATKYNRHELIEYLADTPVDETKLNSAGHTALHVAVQQNNVETLKIYYERFKKKKVDINEKTYETETALHIAAKKGSRKMILHLVELGGDLAARDVDGHTPLHDLLQLIHIEANEEDEEKFYVVWKAIVDVCVSWWCKRLDIPVPDEGSQRYLQIRLDAMYSLRSEITNTSGLSVLEYAATLGLHNCVHIMLTQKNVFIRQIVKNDVEEESKDQTTRDADEVNKDLKKSPREDEVAIDVEEPKEDTPNGIKSRLNIFAAWFMGKRWRKIADQNLAQRNTEVKQSSPSTVQHQEKREKSTGREPTYEIEVSNLMPEYRCVVQTAVKPHEDPKSLRDILCFMHKGGELENPDDSAEDEVDESDIDVELIEDMLDDYEDFDDDSDSDLDDDEAVDKEEEDEDNKDEDINYEEDEDDNQPTSFKPSDDEESMHIKDLFETGTLHKEEMVEKKEVTNVGKYSPRENTPGSNPKHTAEYNSGDKRESGPSGIAKTRNILREKREKVKEIEERERRKELIIGKRPFDFLQTLSKVNPPVKVSNELGTFPMEKLAKHQWYLYQMFIIAYLLLHIAIMLWYTNESETSIYMLNGTFPNRGKINTASSDFIMMIYTAILFVILLSVFLHSKMKEIFKNKKTLSLYGDEEKYSSYVESEGAILNSITYAVAYVAENITRIILTVFISSSILLLVFSRYLDSFTVEHYAWLKGITILSGWIMILLVVRAYSPIYNFLSAFKYIFVKNMVPFILFYVILSVAFGCAIQLQFQLLSRETVIDEQYGNVSFSYFLTSVFYVVWELIIMTAGMDTDLNHIQNVGHLFELEGYGSLVTEILLFTFALISIILLLNMLIATMNDTYAGVIAEQGKGWRQYQVKQAIRIRQLTFRTFDGVVQAIAGARQERATKRWYLFISAYDLKQIRAKYWQDTDEYSK